MFDKFTDRARKVMSLARQEAQRFHHEYIGTEHLLVGLVYEGSGIAARVLERFGVDLTRTRAAIEKQFPPGPPTHQFGQIPFNPRTRRALDSAEQMSTSLGHDYIGTEHLLLGLLEDPEAACTQVLLNLQVNPGEIREEVFEVLSADGRLAPGLEFVGAGEEMSLQQVQAILARDPAGPKPDVPLTLRRLTPTTTGVLHRAAREARFADRSVIGLECVLFALAEAPLRELVILFGARALSRERVLSVLHEVCPPAATFTPRRGAMPLGPDVWQTMDRAWQIALHSGSFALEAIHLLLALLQAEPGVWSRILESCAVPLHVLRAGAELALANFRPALGASANHRLWNSPCILDDAWEVLRIAWREAARRRHAFVGVAHLLLPLLEGKREQAEVRQALERIPQTAGTAPERFDGNASYAIARAQIIAGSFAPGDITRLHLLQGALCLEEARLISILPTSGDAIRDWREEGSVRVHQRPVALAPGHARAETLSEATLSHLHRANGFVQHVHGTRIDPEPVLEALLRDPEGPGVRLLKRIGVNPAEVLASLGPPATEPGPTPPSPDLPLSSRLVRVIAMSAEEAFALRSLEIREEHLLLGMFRDSDNDGGNWLMLGRLAALEMALARSET